MKQDIKKSNLILGVPVLAFAIVFASFFFPMKQSLTTMPPQTILPTIKAHEDGNFYHRALLVSTGCAACHLEPIIADCLDCHPHPPMIIGDNISFPHHDPVGFPQNYSHDLNVSCEVCHDAGDDVRYVITPVGNHDYCIQCHEGEHSPPL